MDTISATATLLGPVLLATFQTAVLSIIVLVKVIASFLTRALVIPYSMEKSAIREQKEISTHLNLIDQFITPAFRRML